MNTNKRPKNPTAVNCRWVSSSNSTVVNYRWGYFSNLLVLLRTSECHKSNCLDLISTTSCIQLREMLATHILTHIFQHTLFDWLKFTWDPPNLYGTRMIWWDPCKF